MAKQDITLPTDLAAAQGQFTRWRAEHKSGTRIPEPLWTMATKLARQYGHNHICRVLKLDYYSLKKRLATSPAKPKPGSAPAFVEILPGQSGLAGRCTVECENTRGERIRIHLQGKELSELQPFFSEFWSNIR
ncbi:MAG: hypothetical protein GY841_23375 [FCB group bacterium]|nr:hypothetical protein [FCB group bacterium]